MTGIGIVIISGLIAAFGLVEGISTLPDIPELETLRYILALLELTPTVL